MNKPNSGKPILVSLREVGIHLRRLECGQWAAATPASQTTPGVAPE